MAWINTRGTRLSQPPGPVEVDWGDPLTQNLLLAVSGTNNRLDAARGAILTPSTTLARTVGPSGVGATTSTVAGTGIISLPATDRYRLVGTPCTIFHFGQVSRTDTGIHSIWSVRDASTQVSQLTVDPTAGTLNYVRGGTGGTGLFLPSTLNATWFAMANDSTSINLYSNNATTSEGGGSFTTSSITPALYNRQSGGRGWAGPAYLTLMFERKLSADEIRALAANPWQLFKPVTRRVYFDVGGSSGLTITPPLLTNSSTLYTPTVSAGGSVVQAPLLTNTSGLFSPTLNPGAVQVAPPLLPSENAFFAPVVSAGGSVVQVPLLTNSSNVFAPTLAAGNVNIAPPVFSNVSVLFEPSVANTGPQTIVAGLFTNTSTLYAPSIGEVAPLTDAEMREMYEKVLAIYAALPSLLTVPKFLALK